jgi:hypothetical protein
MNQNFTAVVAVDEFDIENSQLNTKGHKLEIQVNDEGARIRLITPNTNEANQADIFIEARPDGWHIMAHPSRDEEPTARFIIPNDGQTVKTLVEVPN